MTAYRETLVDACRSVDPKAIARTAALPATAIAERRTLFGCSNGGAAAIADHLARGCLKGAWTDERRQGGSAEGTTR